MEHRIPAGVSQKDAAGVRPAGLDVWACWSWQVQGTPPSTVPCKRRSSVNGERARLSYAADSASGHSYSTIKGGLSSLSTCGGKVAGQMHSGQMLGPLRGELEVTPCTRLRWTISHGRSPHTGEAVGQRHPVTFKSLV